MIIAQGRRILTVAAGARGRCVRHPLDGQPIPSDRRRHGRTTGRGGGQIRCGDLQPRGGCFAPLRPELGPFGRGPIGTVVNKERERGRVPVADVLIESLLGHVHDVLDGLLQAVGPADERVSPLFLLARDV